MKLDSKHFLLKSNFYPNRYKSSNLRFNVLIGIGANVGNCTRRFKKLYLYLQKFPKIDIVKTSLILKNPPFGYLQQNDFYNLLIHIKTNLYPNELLKTLQHIEKHFKRKRVFKNSPRTLDLDIIFFETKKIYNNRLIIPHYDWKNRSSVLIPLLLLYKGRV
jgi:2-amino-4-hydroxy-6-hydroxymethyldihydropteridine diphosphokinase